MKIECEYILAYVNIYLWPLLALHPWHHLTIEILANFFESPYSNGAKMKFLSIFNINSFEFTQFLHGSLKIKHTLKATKIK